MVTATRFSFPALQGIKQRQVMVQLRRLLSQRRHQSHTLVKPGSMSNQRYIEHKQTESANKIEPCGGCVPGLRSSGSVLPTAIPAWTDTRENRHSILTGGGMSSSSITAFHAPPACTPQALSRMLPTKWSSYTLMYSQNSSGNSCIHSATSGIP